MCVKMLCAMRILHDAGQRRTMDVFIHFSTILYQCYHAHDEQASHVRGSSISWRVWLGWTGTGSTFGITRAGAASCPVVLHLTLAGRHIAIAWSRLRNENHRQLHAYTHTKVVTLRRGSADYRQRWPRR